MKKIVVLDSKTLGDVNYDLLKSYGEVTIYEMTNSDEVIERIKDANIILTNKVVLDRGNLKEANELELICEVATGFNNIDIEYAKEKGIGVTNVAGYSTNAVAQHTFSLLLHLVEHVNYYDEFVKRGEYSKSPIFTNLSKPFYELSGKTWGIIGLGAIGKKVAEIASVFGCNVIYYSTSGKNSDNTYKRVEFKELIRQSDIISIHAPLNKNTNALINYEVIKEMKKNAYLLNMGRGPIVVDEDLARALEEDLINGAALDVFTVEPLEENNPLLKIKNKEKLVMSPHIAWAAVEARERLFLTVVENIKAFYNGEIKNRVEL